MITTRPFPASTVLLFLISLVPTGPLDAQVRSRPESPNPAELLTIEVEMTRLPAISQGRTGTCWSYSTTSFLESELERMHGRPVDLSEMHTVYYAYLEKARRYVRLHGKTQFDQGGLCHDVMYVIGKYGVVPQRDYDGLCAGELRHDHGEMVDLLKSIVEKVATSRRPGRKWQGAVRGVLDAYLGEVPATVRIDSISMTPQEYAGKRLKIPTGDYRQLTSYESDPYWAPMELLVPDNWMRHTDYWNLPLHEMLASLDHALQSGFTVAVDIDNSEPTTRGRDSIWTLPAALEKRGAITSELRQEMFDDRRTTDDHLMHIVGIAKHEDGRRFYLTKDSGGSGGPFRGHRMISRNYLMAKMLSFMVHKDALQPKLVARFVE